jgi:mannosyltransferase
MKTVASPSGRRPAFADAAPESRPTNYRPLLAVGVLTALAALLRFSTLDLQSFEYDEILTVSLVRLDFGEFLSAYPHSELGAPLYFTAAWVWEKIFGPGEVGLRSFSALFGTATVPVAYLAAKELVSERAGLVAAALVASSPLLIWFSQEARAYALLVFVATLTFLFFVRALNGGGGRAFAWWALAAAVCLATHYFAIFLVAPEAAVLLLAGHRDGRLRQPLAAVAAVATVGLAFMPLAIAQKATGRDQATFGPLVDRATELPKQYLGGFRPPGGPVLLASAVIVLALVLLVSRADPRERRGALLAFGVGAAALGTPLVLAVLGADFFIIRYLLPAWVPLAILIAVGLAARRAQPVGLLAAAALCGASLLAYAQVETDVTLQRDDWRGAARALGPVEASRAIVLSPGGEGLVVEAYRKAVRTLPPRGTPVSEIVLLDVWGRPYQAPRPRTPRSPIEGFRLVERRDEESFSLLRFRSREPVAVNPDELAARSLPLLDHPELRDLPLLRPVRLRQGPRYFDDPKSRPTLNRVRLSVLIEEPGTRP